MQNTCETTVSIDLTCDVIPSILESEDIELILMNAA